MCGVDAGSGVDSNYIAEGNYIGFKPVDDKKKERRRLMRQDSFFKNMGAFQESKEEVPGSSDNETLIELYDRFRNISREMAIASVLISATCAFVC